MRKIHLKKKIDKTDAAMKTFWRNNERFADLFNAVAFNDKQVIIPDELRPFFSDYRINLVQILDSEHYQFYNENVRDVFDITQKIYTKNLRGRLFKS